MKLRSDSVIYSKLVVPYLHDSPYPLCRLVEGKQTWHSGAHE